MTPEQYNLYIDYISNLNGSIKDKIINEALHRLDFLLTLEDLAILESLSKRKEIPISHLIFVTSLNKETVIMSLSRLKKLSFIDTNDHKNFSINNKGMNTLEVFGEIKKDIIRPHLENLDLGELEIFTELLQKIHNNFYKK